MNEEQIANHIQNTPPTCVDGFHLTPAQLSETFDDNFTTAYHLSCKCHNNSGKILGHYLRDYNSDCNENDDDLITPLGFQCSKCKLVTEIIDTDIHGYHAEIAKLEDGVGSTKYRGCDGARAVYKCPECLTSTFKDIIVGFVYWDFEIMLDEPELLGQDFFNVFLLYVSCQNCGYASKPINLGKL